MEEKKPKRITRLSIKEATKRAMEWAAATPGVSVRPNKLQRIFKMRSPRNPDQLAFFTSCKSPWGRQQRQDGSMPRTILDIDGSFEIELEKAIEVWDRHFAHVPIGKDPENIEEPGGWE